MADIRHAVQIAAPAATVSPLVSTGEGLAKWWAEDMTKRPDGTIDLGFFNRATVYSLRPQKISIPSEAEWLCVSGKEWNGTIILFRLSESNGQTLVQFVHAEWASETEYFTSCNTTWGALMYRLKAVAEGQPARPFFAKNGLAL